MLFSWLATPLPTALDNCFSLLKKSATQAAKQQKVGLYLSQELGIIPLISMAIRAMWWLVYFFPLLLGCSPQSS